MEALVAHPRSCQRFFSLMNFKALKALNTRSTGYEDAEFQTIMEQLCGSVKTGWAYSHGDINESAAHGAISSLNVGAIYFAGEACSQVWYGQLAGAMESSQRMAQHMTNDLGIYALEP